MRNWEFNLYKKIVKKTELELKEDLYKILTNYYPAQNIEQTEDYIIAQGNIPIILMAHMDTVFPKPPEKVIYDTAKSVIYSPQGGIGDDRAGVFAIIKILIDGYLPHIIFTCGEEWGGIGASTLTEHYTSCPFDAKYIIELDRRGYNDCVFYDCENEDFAKYVEKFGFETNFGTFSDISIICPVWRIAGVNLSIGYYNEHSIKEFLYTPAWRNTIKKVEKMLDANKKASYFQYICTSSQFCEECGKPFPFIETVYIGNRKMKVCWNCLNKSDTYCYNCGKRFTPTEKDDILCEGCKQEYGF